MRTFYTPVDLRSRADMTGFLKKHFRYHTMNFWNRSTSYACNLKIHRLGLDGECESKLFDMIDTQEFFDLRRALLDEFDRQHNYLWQAGMNGRSSGYLVLYQGELKPSGYLSFCTECGQKTVVLSQKQTVSVGDAAIRPVSISGGRICRSYHILFAVPTWMRNLKTGDSPNCVSVFGSSNLWTSLPTAWWPKRFICAAHTKWPRKLFSCLKLKRFW